MQPDFVSSLSSESEQAASSVPGQAASSESGQPGSSQPGQATFRFELLHVDRHCGARLGRLITPHGEVQLPAFMPVGTQATVKGLTTAMLLETGTEILLGNTYHLALRPGESVVEKMGGLHKFMGWDRPILTDSGGFQIFSLAKLANIDDRAVTFRSHIDGSQIEISPEKSMAIQRSLGSDIAMALDHLPPLPSSRDEIEDSCRRTILWAHRCRQTAMSEAQALFGIVQGGLEIDLRQSCAEQLINLDFDGYAIGGLSVGEEPSDMYRIVESTAPLLPNHCPRYLMGVGRPEDLLACICRGVDMFDCVMPTRNGRNALAFTDAGPLRMRNASHKSDPRPLDQRTGTPYSNLSRAYIRHLFMAGEMLGPTLLSLHNLAYYQQLMARAREAIQNDSFLEFCRERLMGWNLDPVCFVPNR